MVEIYRKHLNVILVILTNMLKNYHDFSCIWKQNIIIPHCVNNLNKFSFLILLFTYLCYFKCFISALLDRSLSMVPRNRMNNQTDQFPTSDYRYSET